SPTAAQRHPFFEADLQAGWLITPEVPGALRPRQQRSLCSTASNPPASRPVQVLAHLSERAFVPPGRTREVRSRSDGLTGVVAISSSSGENTADSGSVSHSPIPTAILTCRWYPATSSSIFSIEGTYDA